MLCLGRRITTDGQRAAFCASGPEFTSIPGVNSSPCSEFIASLKGKVLNTLDSNPMGDYDFIFIAG